MFTPLFQEIEAMAEALGGQQSATALRQTVAADGRFTFALTPPAPYQAMAVHGFSFGGTVPETFEITLSQRMASPQTRILSQYEIQQGMAVLLGISTAALGSLGVRNLDAINPHPFQAIMWQVNLQKIEDLKIILAAIRKRFCFAEVVDAVAKGLC